MTTATATKSGQIKFTAISPLTTQLLRVRTELQQREGKLKIGRTVFTFFGDPPELDRLLDYLIMNEIPGAGANSKEVRRLRELRRFLRASVDAVQTEESRADAAHVEIQAAPDQSGDRERVLDLLNHLWESASGGTMIDEELYEELYGIASELTELAEANGGPGVDYRAWLSEVL